MNSYTKAMIKSVLIGMSIGSIFALVLGLGWLGDSAPEGNAYIANSIIGWGFCGFLIGMFLDIVRFIRVHWNTGKGERSQIKLLTLVIDDTILVVLVAELLYIPIGILFLVDALFDSTRFMFVLSVIPSLTMMFIYTACFIGIPVALFLATIRSMQLLWRCVFPIKYKRKNSPTTLTERVCEIEDENTWHCESKPIRTILKGLIQNKIIQFIMVCIIWVVISIELPLAMNASVYSNSTSLSPSTLEDILGRLIFELGLGGTCGILLVLILATFHIFCLAITYPFRQISKRKRKQSPSSQTYHVGYFF